MKTPKKYSEAYRKLFRSVMTKRALLRLACTQPEVITGKNEAVIDTVVEISRDYADALLNLRETPPHE